MPSKAKGIEAGKAFIRFGVDDSGVGRSLKRIRARLEDAVASVGKLGAGLAALGATAAAGLGVAFKQFVNVGDALDKLSGRTGVSVELLSALGFAAEQSGSSVAVLETAVKSMQKQIGNLGRGLKTSVDAFTALGLTFEDLDGLSGDEQLKLISDRLADIDDVGKQAAAAMEIFRGAGQKLLPFFTGGSAGIEQFVAEADELAIVIDSKLTKAAAAAADALNRVRRQISAVVVTIGSALAGPITEVAGIISDILPAIREFATNNTGLIRTLGGISAGAVVVGTALAGIAGLILVLPPVIAVVGAGLSALGGLILPGVAVGVAALAASFLPLRDIFRTVTEAADLFGRNVADAYGQVGEAFKGLSTTVKRTASDIRDALAAGDIAAAGQVLFATLKVEFETGQLALITVWENFKADFFNIGADAFLGVATIAIEAAASIGKTFNNLKATLANIFTEIGGQIEEAFGLVKFGASVAANKARGAFDEDFDVEGANNAAAEAQRQTVSENVKIEREARTLIEKERQAANSAVEKTIGNLTASLTEGVNLFKGNVEEAQSNAINQARAELASATQALAEARRTTAELANDNGVGRGRGFLSGAVDFFRDVQDELATQVTGQPAYQARGVFDSRNLRSVGGDDTSTRIAKATEETAKQTKRVADKRGLAFG